jgi:hypothetical protein
LSIRNRRIERWRAGVIGGPPAPTHRAGSVSTAVTAGLICSNAVLGVSLTSIKAEAID